MLNTREEGPADKAGLRGTSRDEFGRLVLGDIITSINGQKMKCAPFCCPALCTVSGRTRLASHDKM